MQPNKSRWGGWGWCFFNWCIFTPNRYNTWTEQNRTELLFLFWLGQYVHHLHTHNIYITRSRYQTNMYMYKSYIIVYIQLVDLCSTKTRNMKVSIQTWGWMNAHTILLTTLHVHYWPILYTWDNIAFQWPFSIQFNSIQKLYLKMVTK